VPAWAPLFLACYQRPQNPSLAEAHRDFARAWQAEQPSRAPSIDAVRRFLAKVARPDLETGRKTGNALLHLKPHMKRKTEKLLPGDVYTADGTTFDAEIAHPDSGRPFKPEVVAFLDVATRRCVGISVALAESAAATLDALRMACLFGGIPAMLYTDNGPGYTADVLTRPGTGMLSRLGIEITNSIPGRPQGKGLMERAVKTLCVPAAKQLATCTHADMDGDAAHKVYKITRAQYQKHGYPKGEHMAFESRRSLLAKVHIAAKALGLEDDAYRDMLEGLTGQRSAGKLTDKQLVLVVATLRQKGWVDEDPRPARKKPTPRSTPGTAPLLEKIGALLADAGRPWAYAVGLAARMYTVERLEWAKPEQLRGVIAALVKDAQRRARKASQNSQEVPA